MSNKTTCLAAIALSIFAITAQAEKIALVGATVVNPADGKVMPNATVVINGDKIESVAMGKQSAATLGKQIDCAGKFISFSRAIFSPDRTLSTLTACGRTKTKSRGSSRT